MMRQFTITMLCVGVAFAGANLLAVDPSPSTASPATETSERNNAASTKTLEMTEWPELPKPVASFGAAKLGEAIYVQGGSIGSAHGYNKTSHDSPLRRLSTAEPTAWTEVLDGPAIQGNALVAVNDSLVLMGGFTAKNDPGEKQDLHSQAEVYRYRPGQATWERLPDLPEPRSSFDAAVSGQTIYVVGGWQLRGQAEDAVWHKTAWKLDLGAETPAWEALPDVPQIRRAVAVAIHQDKLYLVGGMTEEGEPTTRVDVYGLASGTWSDGPALPGEGLDGFGTAACVVGDRLIVSAHHGELYTPSADGKEWVKLDTLDPSRFFHRMVPLDQSRVCLIGGANMEVGKTAAVTILTVPKAPKATEQES